MKTRELSGSALDWAVAKCENWTNTRCGHACNCLQHRDPQGTCQVLPKYASNWAQGGPIIEREKIRLDVDPDCDLWAADMHQTSGCWVHSGTTPLVAAMRCYSASKLGDEVDVPEELL